MDSNGQLILLAYVGLGLNATVIIVGVVTSIIAFFLIKRNGIEEINKAAAIFPTALESVNYSEIPIGVIAVIADHMQISLEDVAAEYAKDAAQRKVLVLQTFRKDPVTDNFIDNFPSKFIQHGYVGEELLAH
ncbi:hypothetical protein L596_024470 [Steinernema carpocapsae]|uniref:Uncharacterized protein n=1 Tax=Steinernema carpocapsae TaxID=34508 RepID=A0A4U5MHT5_STECR|nr:hypothetical protein L596_024470 [Steinernema carpocapsae]